jgi:hypothetical protein
MRRFIAGSAVASGFTPAAPSAATDAIVNWRRFIAIHFFQTVLVNVKSIPQ